MQCMGHSSKWIFSSFVSGSMYVGIFASVFLRIRTKRKITLNVSLIFGMFSYNFCKSDAMVFESFVSK